MFETQFVFLLFFNKTRGKEDRFSHVGRVSDIFFFFFFFGSLDAGPLSLCLVERKYARKSLDIESTKKYSPEGAAFDRSKEIQNKKYIKKRYKSLKDKKKKGNGRFDV
jgi:hypothetical protein